ncbi:dTDP-4-dehydrorhamnose reductase [Clostridium felsineum]|uniref:dTDP-4-dehydrorhamnose reductase n=1 Tax=Clostridium felsineum TaxID=36839 RepID=A0A1S8L3V6_9CLOT|nr:dTDP-4-dehydrorhamnose reductase [Clostridium felsineum]MCR3759873.1 dTDP-4-dehydrorhamnose reductase [Clostridium felsineum]URZ00157.1 dTDP-4-dehydrorhamnose reductase [Clostridium felsineum]URZ07198.1 dTDP-4-dehydrorhamnose reductase [Clostridium felsineum]URZ12227.1 dTDP-4-dehydrorhamnose reductase [Clostridium felsineum]
MKILITGANGQLGREIQKQLKGRDVEVIPTDVQDLDITDVLAVNKFFEEKRPEVVINCAAHTAVDKCEEQYDLAYKINAIGPKNLAAAAYNVGAEIVQISTDYVFDGEAKSPICEFDEENPQSAYGKTKLEGEKFVKALNPKYYIVRTAWLYGDGNNFVKTMISLGKNHDELKVVHDQVGTPTSTVDLARVVLKLVDEKNYGTFHCTCKGVCSWYDFAVEIFRLTGIDVKVNPCTTEEFPRPAKRPKYSVLRNYMLELTTGDITRDWKESLKEYIELLQK